MLAPQFNKMTVFLKFVKKKIKNQNKGNAGDILDYEIIKED